LENSSGFATFVSETQESNEDERVTENTTIEGLLQDWAGEGT